jgi:hypothetical protein
MTVRFVLSYKKKTESCPILKSNNGLIKEGSMYAKHGIRVNSVWFYARDVKAGGNSPTAEKERRGENHRHIHTEGVDGGRR